MAGVDAARFRGVPAPKAGASLPIRYGEASYWSARYGAEGGMEAYDWYLRWEQLKDILMPLLVPESEPASRSAEILLLGCGSSGLGEALYAEGFNAVANVDRCEAVVEAMKKRHQAQIDGDAAGGAKGKKPPDKGKAASPELEVARQPMAFLTADAKALPQDWAGKFDVVIDKAMLDAVACGGAKWDTIDAIMRSVRSVLNPSSGVYLCISHAGPEVRAKMLLGPHQDPDLTASEAYAWELSQQPLPRPLVNPTIDPKAKDKFELTPSPLCDVAKDVYYVYTCRVTEKQQ